MAQAIYDRAMVREQTIWPSFIYGIPKVVIEPVKDIIFGLYANVYLLGHDYLEDIEAERLQQVIDLYEANMSELDTEEQNLVLEIASKKYIKTIEIQIKNNKLLTKTKQLVADEAEYETKLSVLDVDRQALITKQNQLQLIIDKAVLRNKELESKIELEGLAQEYVEVDLLEKQLEQSKVELKILYSSLKGLEIQQDIVEVGIQTIEEEITKAQINADIARLQSQIASYDLTGSELAVAQAELSALEYKRDNLYPKQIERIEKSGELIEGETTNVELIGAKEIGVLQATKEIQDAQTDDAINDLNNRQSLSSADIEQIQQNNVLEKTLAKNRSNSQVTITSEHIKLPIERKLGAQTRHQAAVEAAEIIAAANIVTTLTHEIGGIE